MGYDERSKDKRDDLLAIRRMAFRAISWKLSRGVYWVVSDTSAKSRTERILQEEQQTQKRFSAYSEANAR